MDMRQTSEPTKYFVTGGAGFIGSHLGDKLVEMGEVTVYDNLSSGRKEFIEHHIGKPEFQFIQADVLAFDSLRQAMKGHDIVFHLAANAEAREGIEKTDLDLKIGTIGTYNVLEAMRQNGVKRIVFASSGTVCGETSWVPVSENRGPLLPISLYGASKLAGEGLISAYCHLFHLQAWIFRFANVVGARATHGVIFDFIHKLEQTPEQLEILGNGYQEKPYLLVDDCVNGMLFGLKNSSEGVNVYNLGCSSTTSVNTIAKIVVDEMGLNNVSLKHTGGKRGWPGDVPVVRFDIEKMKRLGWSPSHTSDEAVRIAVRRLLIAGKR